MYSKFKMDEKQFGDLLPFLQDPNITDINWNGSELWIDDLKKGRYRSDLKLTSEFVSRFSNLVANAVSENFNKYNPWLEAETDDLRISIIHESVANTGTSISIRATPPIVRMQMSKEFDEFFKACILAGMRIVIAGQPGSGKTEHLKYLTKFIPANERVITVEDNLEIRYKKINPDKDCVSLRVDDNFTYVHALKAVLRQNPQWIIQSEARSEEVKYLFENFSNGSKCLTTIHTDKASKIPDRLYNMYPSGEEYEKIINQIYQFIDMGVMVKKEILPDKSIKRYISEIVTFEYANHENIMTTIYKDGKFMTDKIPVEIKKRLKEYGYNKK